MDLLKTLYPTLVEKEELNAIPEDILKEIRKNIKDGASDLEQDWANALELVHKAFKIAGVERPTPSEKAAWKQYEELLQYAVEMLYKYREDTDDSWRMSSSVFMEAQIPTFKYQVIEINGKNKSKKTVAAKNLEEIIKMVKKQAGKKSFDVDVEQKNKNSCNIFFTFNNIRHPYHLKIKKIN